MVIWEIPQTADLFDVTFVHFKIVLCQQTAFGDRTEMNKSIRQISTGSAEFILICNIWRISVRHIVLLDKLTSPAV